MSEYSDSSIGEKRIVRSIVSKNLGEDNDKGQSKKVTAPLKVGSVQPRKKANHRPFSNGQGASTGMSYQHLLYLFDNELINFESKTST